MYIIDIINTNLQFIREILVVVFGVLIAFTIQNISEERKRRKRIKQILEIVKINFKEDIENIKKELDKLDNKKKSLIGFTESKVNKKNLDDKIKFEALNLLLNHPTIELQKEGFYLLRDADFNYDTKRNKIVSEIITMYSYNFKEIERQRDRVIRTSEQNTINHMQDPWHYYDQGTEAGMKKILNYLDKIIDSDFFINELDYMAQCVFGNYRRALENYLKAINLILEKLEK